MKALTIFLLAAGAMAQVPMPPPQVPGAPPKPAAKAAPRPAAGRAPARPAAAATYKDLKYPAARMPQLPPFKRFQLANGIKVLLAENHEIPMVHGAALVRTGSVFDPAGREGLAGLTGALLRGGGARQRTPEQIDSELDRLGAVIDSNTGDTMGAVTFSSLKGSLAPALALFRDMLTAPAFRSDRLDLAKSATFNRIARRNDDAQQLLRREFLAVLYGKDNPLSRRPEYASIAQIQRADVERFYHRYYFPANTLLVFSGDFDSEAMKGALESLFAEWRPEQQPVPGFPQPPADAPGGAFLASKPDARQTTLAFGRPGAAYRDKDAAALEVAANLLARGAETRLKRGVSADAGKEMHADAQPGLAMPATFVLWAAMPPGSANDAIAAAVEELGKLRSAEAGEDDLRLSRDAVWQRVARSVDTAAKAAFTVATAEYYGYPADYPEQYLKAVSAVTGADVLRVAKERLDPARFTLAVVSNSRAFVDPRTSTAAKPIDLTIPTRPAVTPATAESPEEAKRLLRRAQAASGGVEKLAAVKDVTTRTVHTLISGGKDEEFDQWIAPSMLREDGTSTVYGRLIRFTDGTAGWISTGYTSAPLAGPTLKQVVGDALRQPLSLLLSDRVPGRMLGLLDERTIEITQGDISVRLVFDPATGLPAEMHYEVPNDRSPGLIQETYSDYRDVNGIKLPFHVVTMQNGTRYAEGNVTEIRLDQGLKPEALQKRP